MVNSSPQTQVYCTRPSCQYPLNPILEEGIGVLVHVQPNADNKPMFVRLQQPSNVSN